MRVPILERLAAGDVLIADGATGTMLQAAGLPTGMPGEAWVLEQPEEIMALHRAYVEAGSRFILTTTFGGTRARLKAAGLAPKVAEINRRAGELARQVAGDELYVGGDIGPSGEMMPPLGKLTYSTAVEMFSEQAEALASGGVDCIYIETMSDLNEAKAAVEGAQKAATVLSRALPVFCTFSFDTHGHTGMGINPVQAAQAMDQMGVQATGANCGHAPEEVLAFLPQMRQAAPNAFMIAKPNAGVPRMVNRQAVYDADPERMADLAHQFVELEARIVGACCGSSPEHITAMSSAVHQERS